MKKILTFLLISFLFVFLISDSCLGQGSKMVRHYVGIMQDAGVTAATFKNIGVPKIRGTWYYVDPTDGKNTYTGLDEDHPLQSIDSAYAKCTSGYGDGIMVFSYGTTTSATTSLLTTGIQWTKHGITVYGVAAPTWYNMRARVADSTGIDTLAYLITVRGANNTFYNIDFVNSPDDSLGGEAEAVHSAIKVPGIRNAFINCGFMCSPDDANASKCDLWLSGADENLFSHCMIGNGSYDAGDNAACHIYIDGTTGNGQNLFENCKTIQQVSTGTAFGCVESGSATSLNGLIIFDNCSFYTWQANAGLTAMASWFIGTKPTTGQICLHQCGSFGFAEWDSVAGNDRVTSDMPTAAASAGGGLATHK